VSLNDVKSAIVHDPDLLPVARLAALHVLEHPDPQSTAEVASALGVSAATALRALRALQERQLVRQIHDLWAFNGGEC